jgi:hypothetical protein
LCGSQQGYFMKTHLFAVIALAFFAAPGSGQTQSGGAAGEAQAEDIVVTARASGVPIWEARVNGSTVLLVGEITNVPKATHWRPERLQAATERADRVILGVKASFTIGDIFRLMFKLGKLKHLPAGHSTVDYLSPAEQTRLTSIEGRTHQSYGGQSMLITGFGLLTRELRFNHDTADDASEIVRDTARNRRITTRPVGVLRGKEILDSLFSAAPETHVPCLHAAMAAYENGPDGVQQRGRDWTELDVPGVMASPIEDALGACWPWTDGRYGPELRRQWEDALEEALRQPGVTLAVVPLRVLAEGGGALDRLTARGVVVKGPRWRR